MSAVAPRSASQVRSIFALGPEGTFSDQAARRAERYYRRVTGADARVVLAGTVAEVAKRTATEPDCVGVIPIENSHIGAIAASEQSLVRHELMVEWELHVKVRFR